MSKILSLQQKKNLKAIELMFKELDDDYLKNALLCAYAGQDEAILEELAVQQQKDYEAILEQMKIQNIEEVYMAKDELDAKNAELISQCNITKTNDGDKNDKQQDIIEG